MSVSEVLSVEAFNATGKLWSATVGMPDDVLPEIPTGVCVCVCVCVCAYVRL